MSAYRVLVEFLRLRAKVSGDNADIRLKDAHPNKELIGKFRNEQRMFAQAADLIEVLPAPSTRTSEESDRERLSAPPTVITKPAKKIGRPPKMTAKEIAAASQGPAVRQESVSEDQMAAEALRRA